MTTYFEARDAIYGVVKSTVDDAASYIGYIPEVEYPSITKIDNPPIDKIWLRANMTTVGEPQSTLSTCIGEPFSNRYTSFGLVIIELYIPKQGNIYELATQLATHLRDVYRKSGSSSGVIYRKARINDNISAEANFKRINVIAEYEYDEIL